MNAPKTSVATLIRYGVVGVFGGGIYLVGTSILHQHAQLSVPAAATALFVPVVVINYVLHYSWTFQSRRPHGSAVPRFLGTAVVAMAINYLVVSSGTRWFRLSQTAVLVFGVLIVVAWNYLLSRFWVFVDRSRE